jgi:hypothetical protein
LRVLRLQADGLGGRTGLVKKLQQVFGVDRVVRVWPEAHVKSFAGRAMSGPDHESQTK